MDTVLSDTYGNFGYMNKVWPDVKMLLWGKNEKIAHEENFA